jgi:hypothetical protein
MSWCIRLLVAALTCAAFASVPAPAAETESAGAAPAPAAGAGDPYAAWMQGRPQEAIPALLGQAEADQRWTSWYDCGLAAAAAGDPRAAAWLLTAHHRAPARGEPLVALRALDEGAGAALPVQWCERLGPAAALGAGWPEVALLGLLGLGLGWALAAPRRRRPGALAALAALVLVAPGLSAAWHDRRDGLVAALRDTSLVDSTGAPVAPIAGGTLLRRAPIPPWSGRVLVTAADGQRGWLPLVDIGGE